jgi:hypothetical protein
MRGVPRGDQSVAESIIRNATMLLPIYPGVQVRLRLVSKRPSGHWDWERPALRSDRR